MNQGWIDELKQVIGENKVETKDSYVKRMSQDFYWYSPILKKQLSDFYADCIVKPSSVEEVIEVLAFSAQNRIPLVPRGGGTGNYGQIIPMEKGIILDTSALNKIIEIKNGIGRFGAGIKLGKLEADLANDGYSLRFFPSTYLKSTLGGFIAGGTGGIGSIEYGTLWDEGNVVRLTILTLEEKPRLFTIEGEELKKYIHHYGLSGVIIEAEIALAPYREWEDHLVTFSNINDALSFSESIAKSESIRKRLVSVSESPLATAFKPFEAFVSEHDSIVLLQVEKGDCDQVEELAHSFNGSFLPTFSEHVKKNKVRTTDFSWNHVTLWWMKHHPEATYLQGRFDTKNYLKQVELLKEKYPNEVLIHFEWISVGGSIVPSSQPIISYTTEERLNEIITYFKEIGVKVSNPHTYLIEEGGKDDWVELISLAKKENDPYQLLNPGKMKIGIG
ncbi:FAD-binding oxidoreductase [Alkalihalobacillus trypoxylicola]|uniref:FAD-binding PCMH-type domain-containing protein n=1 Tax=Alkalihalobacillus trypoxylicola TaxID=519424 RepID=A0A162DSX0_9BACI|nr:FAD-binding oxidoreductase [Alkalihalobacillus trypoxylicola]KYG30755.1 hypothetical protein AZF04_18885 [Alkalihalobacillus trypoxylicola]